MEFFISLFLSSSVAYAATLYCPSETFYTWSWGRQVPCCTIPEGCYVSIPGCRCDSINFATKCVERDSNQDGCLKTAANCGSTKWTDSYCCGDDIFETPYQENLVWKCALGVFWNPLGDNICDDGTHHLCEASPVFGGTPPSCDIYGHGQCPENNYVNRDSYKEICEGSAYRSGTDNAGNPIFTPLCSPNDKYTFATWTDNANTNNKCCGNDPLNDNFVYTDGSCVNGVPRASSCDNTCNSVCQSKVDCTQDPDCTQGTNLCEGQACTCDAQCAHTSTGAGFCKDNICIAVPYWMYINVRNSGDTGAGAVKKTCGSPVSDFTCSYDDACTYLGNGNFQGAATTYYYNATGWYTLSWSSWTSFTCGLADNAQFISQVAPPANMNPGQTATVSVTMKNIGSTTWTKAAGYKLGSQNPQDNTNWGLGRVELDAADSIAPGQQKTFSFTITAPSAAGSYNFQWRMIKEGVAWFGEYSTNVAVTVAISTCGNGVADAGETCCNCPQDAGCGEGTRCMADCTCGPDVDGPVCVNDGTCASSESCNCVDCMGKQDSCLRGLVCCADNLCCCNPTPDGICPSDQCKEIDPDCPPYFVNFTFTSAADQSYFNVFWKARWPLLSPTPNKYVNVSCVLGCDPRTQACNCNPAAGVCSIGQMCLPYPFYQPPGEGSCTVANPQYDYSAKNKIICKVYDSTDASKANWY